MKIVDRSTCAEEDSTFVFVDVFFSNFYVDDEGSKICEGDEITLKAGGGVQYVWRNDHGETVGNSAVVKLAPKETTDYFVEIIDVNQCLHEDTVSVQVVSGIDVEWETGSRDCHSDLSYNFINLTPDSLHYDSLYWDFGDGAFATEGEVAHAFPEEGVYTVKLSVVRDICTFYEARPFQASDLNPPNVITPSPADGKNDRFVITGADKIDLAIYNRWGGLVYEKQDYQGEWNAENVNSGVYYYRIVVDDSFPCNGWVNVMK